jgi:hypothetical protein
MIFENPFFLYLLPLCILPLLIILKDRLIRQNFIFPSLEIIKEILIKESKKLKFHFVLTQFFKFLCLFSLILGFSKPVISEKKKVYTVVIDPTCSMKEFELYSIIEMIKEKFRVEKIFFGENEFNGEFLFNTTETNISKILNKILKDNNSILLVTDGQKVNFKNFNIKKITNLSILLLKHRRQNLYFKKIEISPYVITKNSKIYLSGEINTNVDERLKIFFNENLVSEIMVCGKFTKEFIPDPALVKPGTNRLKVLIDAFDFKSDNESEFLFYYKPSFKVYINSTSMMFQNLMSKIMKSIFPDVDLVNQPSVCDIIFSDSFLKTEKISFYFIEKELGEFYSIPLIKWDEEVSGKLSSSFFPAISLLKDVKLRVKHRILKENPLVKDVLKVENTPVMYKIRNSYLSTFSVSQNLTELSSNPFLTFFIYEAISHSYIEKSRIDNFLLEESIFEFYSKAEMKKLISAFANNTEVITEDEIKEKKGLILSNLFFAISLAFFILIALFN